MTATLLKLNPLFRHLERNAERGRPERTMNRDPELCPSVFKTKSSLQSPLHPGLRKISSKTINDHDSESECQGQLVPVRSTPIILNQNPCCWQAEHQLEGNCDRTHSILNQNATSSGILGLICRNSVSNLKRSGQIVRMVAVATMLAAIAVVCWCSSRSSNAYHDHGISSCSSTRCCCCC